MPPQTNPPPVSKRRQGILVGLFAVMLLGFGGVLFYLGTKTVRTRHFESQWESSSSFGVGHGAFGHSGNPPRRAVYGGMTRAPRQGMYVLDGAEATRWGVGLYAFGGLLALGGISVLCGLIRGDVPGQKQVPREGFHPVAWLSFACLLTAAGCLLPPWETAGQCALAAAALVLSVLCGWPRPWPLRLGRTVFPALVIIALVAGQFSVPVPVGIVLGIFLGIAVFSHLAVLRPDRFAGAAQALVAPETGGPA